MQGVKFDEGKVRYDYISPEVLEQVAWVLTKGAQKYGPNNWKAVVRDDPSRYLASLKRHIAKWELGEQDDPEWNLHHLSHAICCCIFLIWKDLDERDEKEIS